MARFPDQSRVVTVFALLVAGVALVGTQFFGWEWGSGQAVPTGIGIVVAVIAVAVVVRRLLN